MTREDEDEIRQSWQEGMALLRPHIADTQPYYESAFWAVARSARAAEEQRRTFGISRAHPRGLSGTQSLSPTDYELGHVYVLHAENHLFKIGKSKQVDARIEQIGLIVPMEIRLVHSIITDHMSAFERFLHRLFAHRRIRGEWFQLSFWDFLFLMERDSVQGFQPETTAPLANTIADIAQHYEFDRMPRYRDWSEVFAERLAHK